MWDPIQSGFLCLLVLGAVCVFSWGLVFFRTTDWFSSSLYTHIYRPSNAVTADMISPLVESPTVSTTRVEVYRDFVPNINTRYNSVVFGVAVCERVNCLDI